MASPRTRPAGDLLLYRKTAASVQIDPGDLLYEVGGLIYPASSQADQGTEAANQQLFAAKFAGVSNGQKVATDATNSELPVIVGSEVEFTLASATTVAIGDLLAADENSGGDGLLDQTCVVTTDPAAAIARVTENKANATRCFAMPLSKFTTPSAAQSGFKLIAQTIAMGDAAVTLTKVPGTPTGVYLFGNLLLVDPESGQASENLLLPPEADMVNETLIIKCTGGEHIVVQNDAGGTVCTIEDAESAILHCDGTTWTKIQFVETT